MHHRDFSGRRVSVLGAARSGRAAAVLLARAGAQVLLSELGPVDSACRTLCSSHGIAVEDQGHSNRVLEVDLMVLSPGVPTSAAVVQAALKAGIPVYSELEVAAWFCDAPMVAITGTNGKTTTTALLGYILKEAGRRVLVAGNIGTPLSALVHQAGADSVVVLEVSSFQLDHTDTFRPRISVLLNITPDHLDRYEGVFDRYVESKLRVFRNQTRGDVLVYNYDDTLVRNRVESVNVTAGVERIPYSTQSTLPEGAWLSEEGMLNVSGEPILGAGELGIPGPHNVSNSLAAAMAARVLDIGSGPLREALREFTGVQHRLEYIRTLDGVRYINDSKATNVNALWFALESFDEPVVLLAGGRDKGNCYDTLTPLVRRKVKALIAFGESADTVMQALGPLVGRAERAGTLEEATVRGRACAEAGDVVLLSPACASFDLFDNFEARGDAFRTIVEGLH
ncbi:MAG: UDP-N-acetylmuramoyl-L-alanine--D-glutamate ligase [Bacteroidota bacterium]|nr:UDP-N-acetylmuramoyl-L-alanine--D-glutamate ligase [Bacteroidota bacterium]